MSETIFWSCREPERLSLESPEEALEELFDAINEPDVPLLEQIAQCAPVTVQGYGRAPTPSATPYAESAVERFEETVFDEYGDPDGDTSDLLDKHDRETLVITLTRVFDAALQKAHFWACERTETRVYSAEEVEAVLRESCPEWFDELRP